MWNGGPRFTQPLYREDLSAEEEGEWRIHRERGTPQSSLDLGDQVSRTDGHKDSACPPVRPEWAEKDGRRGRGGERN